MAELEPRLSRRPLPPAAECTPYALTQPVRVGPRSDIPPVLLITDRSSIPWEICDGLLALGLPLVICADAVSAMQAALADPPACIVSDTTLPDVDGHTMARWLRAHDVGPLAGTTMLLRTPAGDFDARLRGYRAGADVCVSRALPAADVVAQVQALLRFAGRERSAIEGAIGAIELPTLLQLLELEGRTGVFEVESEGCAASLVLRGGKTIAGRLFGAPTTQIEALRAMLGWRSGRFGFRPVSADSIAPSSAGAQPIGVLLMEAARLHDEAAA